MNENSSNEKTSVEKLARLFSSRGVQFSTERPAVLPVVFRGLSQLLHAKCRDIISN
jgi:hypothetical protein